jgi:hypothetical protein
MITEHIEDILAILFGLFLILSRKWQAHIYAKIQGKFFGAHLSSTEIRLAKILNIVVGAVFLLVGILSIFGIVDAR